MLQTDLRSDTPAARQRFTDRRREHEFVSDIQYNSSRIKHTLHAALTTSISTLLMRASLIAAGACNRRPLLCRSCPASRFDRAPAWWLYQPWVFWSHTAVYIQYTPRVGIMLRQNDAVRVIPFDRPASHPTRPISLPTAAVHPRTANL